MSSVFNSEAMLFSVKSLVAAILALYIALSLGQSEPSWAILTTYIVPCSRKSSEHCRCPRLFTTEFSSSGAQVR